jgi:hypothetical protein
MSQHYIATWKGRADGDRAREIITIYSHAHNSREAAINDLDIMFDLDYPTKVLLYKTGFAKISIRYKNDTIISAMGCCCLDPKRHNFTEEE